MRYFALIFWIALSPKFAYACSYPIENPFKAWKSATLLFEGYLVEIRLNGTHVRFSDIRYFLQLTNEDIHIETIVKPTRVFIGPKKESFKLHIWYNRDGICVTAPQFLEQTNWSAIYREGPFGSRHYLGPSTEAAISVPKAALAYLGIIDDLDRSQLTQSANNLIENETDSLERLLAGDKSLNRNSFFSNQVTLTELPIEFLNERLDFLLRTGLSIDETARTQAAIQLK